MTAATVPPVVAPVAPVMQQPQPIRQPAPIIPPPVQQPVVEDETEQQKALLMKVLQLTDDQINALPPQTRDQIRQLVSFKEQI
jgi:cleavage stimulation factor subunit 2